MTILQTQSQSNANDSVMVNTPSLPADDGINAPFMDQVKQVQKASDNDFVRDNTALSAMQDTLASIKEELDNLRKTQVTNTPPKTSNHNSIFEDGDDYEMVLGNKELFTTRMNNYIDKRELALKRQYDERINSLQGSLSDLPNNLMHNVREQAFMQRSIEDFFRENPDLDFRHAEDSQGKAVATFFTSAVGDLVAKNPNVSLDKLLDKAGDLIRKTVNLSQFTQDDEYENDPAENFAFNRPVSPRNDKKMSMNRQVIQNLLSHKGKGGRL